MSSIGEVINGVFGVKTQQPMQIGPLPDYDEQLAADQAKETAEAAARRRKGLREQLTVDLPERDGAGTGLQIPI